MSKLGELVDAVPILEALPLGFPFIPARQHRLGIDVRLMLGNVGHGLGVGLCGQFLEVQRPLGLKGRIPLRLHPDLVGFVRLEAL